MPRLLDDVLLGELEAEWRAQGVDYLDAFRPGLDDAEIDRATEPLGFELPEEARRWYRWRDGSDAYDVVFARYIASLREAVEMTVDNVAIVPDDWRDGWLRAMSERPDVAFDCAVPNTCAGSTIPRSSM